MARAKGGKGIFIKTDGETAKMAGILRTRYAVNISQLLRMAIADAFHRMEGERKQ